MLSSRIVNGTRVSNTTSLVIHVDKKKHNKINMQHSILVPFIFFNKLLDIMSKKPMLLNPLITIIKQNKIAKT